MPNIKPVSDLRNYGEVLRDVAVGQPVYLSILFGDQLGED